jgi:hypothetical protein
VGKNHPHTLDFIDLNTAIVVFISGKLRALMAPFAEVSFEVL